MAKTGGGARWRVISASFEKSATGLADLPASVLPEVAVAGRSNVGKSSLLNAFAGQRGLARVSRTPGRTRLLNCFDVRLRNPQQDTVQMRWVDLPGYGYAEAPRAVRDSFGPMIEAYLRERDELRAVIMLVDARRGLQDAEFELLEFLADCERRILLCATKTDKLTASERGVVARQLAKPVGADPRDVLLTSASTGLGLGDEPKHGGLARELGELVTD
jgi:GTP-binding protein